MSLGEYSSILIEGNFNQLLGTTGNTLIVAFIVQAVRVELFDLSGRPNTRALAGVGLLYKYVDGFLPQDHIADPVPDHTMLLPLERFPWIPPQAVCDVEGCGRRWRGISSIGFGPGRSLR